ncbi:MAG: ribonuclease D [Robiginitomaculum sp.]|nr:MAG: ribonuclease D [Robiginitomaculum sp.]
MNIIKTTASLEAFCEKAASSPFLVVDTEFMREKTFFSQLCLIQVATPNDEAIIDPLAEHIDLTAFLSLLTDKNIIKVMHAARQDMEIFYKLCGEVPAPLFDTQLAAMALGFGDSVGYMSLVKGRLDIQLDKGARFTDWSRRPLSEKQLSYAIADVTHLRDLYPDMVTELSDKGRTEWVEEETQILMDENLYSFDPERAWMRMKPRQFRRDYLSVLKAMSAWREREAILRDIPRNRVLKDDGIYDIAQRKPKTLQDLGNLRGVPNGFERRKNSDRVIKAIQDAIKNAETYAPVIKMKKQKPPNLGPSIDMLKTLLRLKTEYADIAPRLVANVADIEDIAAFGMAADVRALKGWRWKIFGEDALKMLEGKISLCLKDGEVIAVDMETANKNG